MSGSDPGLSREPVAPLRAEDLAQKTVGTVPKVPYWNEYVPADRMCSATYHPVTADTERARLRDLRERMLLEAARGPLTGSRVVEVARQWVKFVEEG